MWKPEMANLGSFYKERIWEKGFTQNGQWIWDQKPNLSHSRLLNGHPQRSDPYTKFSEAKKISYQAKLAKYQTRG